MYRKRMSEALQEARAFSLVNEVMVFKGGRGMNISKKDLPVFKAKGWKLKEELEEANMKRLLQALQDKLSKEGGAAGFDDLKKTAKTMGVNLTPDMLKGAPGIKQHRDGDYILEGGPGSGPQKGKMKPGAGTRQGSAKDGGQTDKEADDYDSQIAGEAIVGNPNLSKFMFMFKDTSSVFGGMRQQGKLITAKNKSAAEAEFKRALPKAKIVSVKEVGDLYGYEETELEEAFSKKDFQKLEQSNDHTEAAKKLIDMFGTSDEKKEMNDIKTRHEKTGYISGKDYSRRIQLTNRYYSRLK